MSSPEINLTNDQRAGIRIITGEVNPGLAYDVAEYLGVEVTPSEFHHGEGTTEILGDVEHAHAYVFQGHKGTDQLSVHQAVEQHHRLARMARLMSAGKVHILAPFLAYSRVDILEGSNYIPTAEMLRRFEAEGVDSILSYDLAYGQMQGFTQIPLVAMTAFPTMVEAMRADIESRDEDTAVISPYLDGMNMKVVEKLGSEFNIAFGGVHHWRYGHNGSSEDRYHIMGGGVEGRNCIIVGNSLATGLSALRTAQVLEHEGAANISVYAMHASMDHPAIERMQDPVISKVVVTNTLPQDENQRELGSKLQVESVALPTAQTIAAHESMGSISKVFGYHQQR